MLAAATNHPDILNPISGLFNARSIRALSKRDIRINAVVPRPFAPPFGPYSEYQTIPDVWQAQGYEVHHPRFFYGIPKHLFYGLAGASYAKRISQYAERSFITPDVVHAYHIYLDGYGMIPYCQANDLPLFVVAHGTVLNEFDTFSQGVRSKIRETLEMCETVLCVSEALTSRATEIVPEVETRVVPLGADPNVFPTDHAAQIRRELGIPEDAPVVLFCGKYIENKGVGEIIDVLPEFADSNLYFLFVGHDGDLRVPLQEQIVDTKMADRVQIYHDVLPIAMRRFFAVADLLLLPSYREGRPTVIYEAMASKTGVLASNVGGIPEQVTDGETGKLIPPKDVSALRIELQELCTDRARLQEMGKVGYRTLLEEGWTWEGHAERVERIHREYLGGETV